MALTRAGFEFDSETYHGSSATHRFEFDPASTPPSMAVVSALSTVLDVAPTDLDPIQETIDTDALDAFVRDQDLSDAGASVAWTQTDFAVTVHSDGVVTLSPTAGEPARPPGNE